jgi:hypothetical protein
MSQPHWYQSLTTLRSLGSTAERPGSLAALAERRRQTLSQFFTPEDVACFMWRIAEPALNRALTRSPDAKVSVLDNSIGSGRLVRLADPERHRVLGLDVHADSVIPLARAMAQAGFDTDILTGGMESIRVVGRCGLAIINPPFSITLASPTLEPFPSTCYGAFGPNTSAVSHAYALDHAMASADIVVALLPRNYALERIGARPARLRAAWHLPASAFADEGCAVETSVLVFGRDDVARAFVQFDGAELSQVPDLGLDCCSTSDSLPCLQRFGQHAARPTIITPVTGDRSVRIAHDGRRVVLGFACGFIESKVRNALLDRPVDPPTDRHRYPKSVAFKGDGQLDLELHLAQPDPMESFKAFVERIRALGATPHVDAGVWGYLRKRVRRDARMRIPFKHVALDTLGDAPIEVTPRGVVRVDPTQWIGPVFMPGTRYSAISDGDAHIVTHPVAGDVRYTSAEFVNAFTVVSAAATPAWRVAHPGRIQAEPALAAQIRRELVRRGIDRIVSWDYQSEDVVELLMGRHAAAAHAMGLGKTRIAIALAKMGGEANLLCLEAQLIAECVRELQAVGIPESDWQVIETTDQARNLRRINLISVVRLRLPIAEGSKRTIADLLRRRISLMVVDECQMLRNPDSARSRAIRKVSPKRRFGLSGTPVVHQPRELIQLMIWAYGDGTALQPYGRYRPYLRPALIDNMDTATTGASHWMAAHAELRWVTHQFEVSGLVTGAKREIPAVRDLDSVRAWVAPLLKRRVSAEPEVARYFRTPEYDMLHHTIDFDMPHLAYVLKVADHFAEWWRNQRKAQADTGKNINIVSILARIGALQRAVTFPQFGADGFGAYFHLTSKQRAIIARLKELAGQGKKVICYVENPGMADLIAAHLAASGVDAMAFTGDMPIVERTRALDQRFRFGPCSVLVATLGVTQVGLNLYQASHAVFACYGWSNSAVRQAMARLLRPQQTERVLFEFFALAGSLDCYQKQICTWKADVSDAVLDLLQPQLADSEFLHLDAILDQFVASLAEQHAMTPWQYREAIAAHA